MRKPFLFLLLSAAGFGLLAALATPPSASAQATLDGRQIFLNEKCNLCHAVGKAGIEATVKSEKIRGPDLSEVADRPPAVLTDYLRQKTAIDGEKHKKAFKGSDEELGALVSWLARQND
ncbi:MAG TPA: cytochrome c [Thermoanaerobaculia bacterium]|nr:cytochrome c [Thermoanaerobaculia bacterium]